MKEFVIYTAMRLLLFAGAFAIVYGIWAAVSDDAVNGLVVFVVAFLLSGLASYYVLDSHREALARRVQARAEAASARLEDLRSREDDEQQ